LDSGFAGTGVFVGKGKYILEVAEAVGVKVGDIVEEAVGVKVGVITEDAVGVKGGGMVDVSVAFTSLGSMAMVDV